MVTLHIQGLTNKLYNRIVPQYTSDVDNVYYKGDIVSFNVKIKDKNGDIIKRVVGVDSTVISVRKLFGVNHTDIFVELDIPSLMTIGDIISILDRNNDDKDIDLDNA